MLLFGDIVVVDKNLIGVIVKEARDIYNSLVFDIYVRELGRIKRYKEAEVERYLVRQNVLSNEDYINQKILGGKYYE